MRSIVVLLLLLPAIAAASPQWQGEFDADSAYANTRYLAVTVGPRPMGSKAERRALNWVASRFRQFGADTAWILQVPEAQVRGRRMYTQSGVAIGVFRGETDSSIVVGGHLDSSGPEIPGANDDASGTACVIELARLWSQRPRRYTLIFAAFGGEEQGLVGSRLFVQNFPGINSVQLMLQIDMAGSPECLIPFLETGSRQAPRWLVRDLYRAAGDLGYHDLCYPTHFFSINNAISGAGSDHEPFLRKGIPAIDLTAGVNTSPIHTPQDRLELVQPAMLARSGRIVDALLSHYMQEGIPQGRFDRYMLWQVGETLLFAPSELLWLLVAAAIGLAVVAGYRSRRAYQATLQNDPSLRGKGAGWKTLLSAAFILLASQVGEAILQVITRYRYPWFTHLSAYLGLALLFGMIALWVLLYLAPRIRWPKAAHPYALRAMVALFVWTGLLLLPGPRLAFYPAATLLLFSVAMLSRPPWLKAALVLLAFYPMTRLLFMEMTPFLAHGLAMSGLVVRGFLQSLLYTAVLTLFLLLWFAPHAFMLNYLFRAASGLQPVVELFRRRGTGIALAATAALCVVLLANRPAYNTVWKPLLGVDFEYTDLSEQKSRVVLQSNEFLRDLQVTGDTTFTIERSDRPFMTFPASFTADWFLVQGAAEFSGPSSDTVLVDWKLSSKYPWWSVTVTLSSDSSRPRVLESLPRLDGASGRNVEFTWQFEPPDTLYLWARLVLPPHTRLIRRVAVTYLQMPMDLQVSSPLFDVRYRTHVVRVDTLAPAISRTGE